MESSSNADVYLELWYNIKTDMFGIDTNLKPDCYSEIVSTFLVDQIGAGRDNRKPQEREVYNITIKVDLSYDNFHVSDDTGNKGLRDGILMRFLSTIDNKFSPQ